MCHSCMIDAPAASMGTTASDISVISMEKKSGIYPCHRGSS